MMRIARFAGYLILAAAVSGSMYIATMWVQP